MSTIELKTAMEEGSDHVAGLLVAKDLTVLGRDLQLDASSCERRGFSGKANETLWQEVDGDMVLLVGIGDSTTCGPERLRRAAAALVQAAKNVTTLTIDVSDISLGDYAEAAIAEALGEGAILGSYRYDADVVTPPKIALTSVVITGKSADDIATGVARAKAIGEVVAIARDLINTPPSDLTPIAFAKIASDLAAREQFDIEVFDEQALEAGGFGGVLGVARGSTAAPRFLRCVYEPTTASAVTVALVGKGVTFDSGGLSLKSGEGMMTMKTDMSGAAAVLGAMAACRRLNIGVRVVGYMPLTENMPGGSAIKPGDVLKAKNGKTIEVLNTDAEGRLILADALSLAEEAKPDAIVDLATLTGACVQALGSGIAGLIGNDDRLIDVVQQASQRAGEPLWQLPLPADYRSRMESDVADMRNIPGAGAGGGALTAALILEEFVGTTPWVHLDIAGPARSGENSGYLRKGGTGFGVRTLLELLKHYEELGGVAEGSKGKVVMSS